MDINSILNDLTAQRDRISNAIAALEGSAGKGRRGRRPGATAGKKPRRRLSAAARKRMSDTAKRRWAAAKKAGKNAL